MSPGPSGKTHSLQELVRDLSARGSLPVLLLLSSAVIAALWIEKQRAAANGSVQQ